MRRIVLLLVLSLGLPALALLSGVGSAEAGRHSRVNAAYVARIHAHHGHAQYQSGRGTAHHTWANYRRQARALRHRIHRAEVRRQRHALVARWQGVADCEAGGNWHINTGNGHYGGLQFNLSTWQSYGGSGMPHQQDPWRQAEVAERVRNAAGLSSWPHCGSRYG